MPITTQKGHVSQGGSWRFEDGKKAGLRCKSKVWNNTQQGQDRPGWPANRGRSGCRSRSRSMRVTYST